MDLGVVIQDSQSRVNVEVNSEDADANAFYDEATNNLKYRTPVMRAEGNRVTSVEKEQAAKEYYASVRTNVRILRSPCALRLLTHDAIVQVLLAWVVSNVRR
jgi:chitin synthase